jgi:hypothetical protein
VSLGLAIAALLLTQNLPPPAVPPPQRGFEDKFLTFSQAVLVVGVGVKVVAQYSRDPSVSGRRVAADASLAGSVVAVEVLAKRKMSAPVKYVVGTANIVAGVVLGIFAHHDSQVTRAVVQGLPPPTY